MTDIDIIYIKKEYENGMTFEKIGRRHHVTKQAIHNLAKKMNWQRKNLALERQQNCKHDMEIHLKCSRCGHVIASEKNIIEKLEDIGLIKRSEYIYSNGYKNETRLSDEEEGDDEGGRNDDEE